MTEPMPPPVPIWAMIAEHDVLGRDARRRVAVDDDRHRPRPHLRQRLSGEHVLDLARADPERQRAERAVRGGVAVAAHDRHARLREALFGPDHVHDALARVAHAVEADAELLAVPGEHVHLLGRDRVGQRLVEIGRRDVVVHRRDGEVGPPHGPPGGAQTVERLRRRHLVHEVQVDVEEVGFAGRGTDHVAVPELLGEGLGGVGHDSLLSQYMRR